MARTFRNWLRWTGLVLLALACVQYTKLCGYFVPNHNTPVLDELIPKIGDALLIAWFISLIVDIGAKKELIGEFLFDSSAHIIGRQLPEQIREEVREYLNVPFIRPVLKITYQLTPVLGQPAAELKATYWGELQNLTTKTRLFKMHAALDAPFMQAVPSAKLVRVEFRKNRKNLLKTTHTGLKFSEKIKIKPGRHGRCESVVECVEYFPENYEYAMINEATVQRAELTIHWDKSLFDVEVNLSSGGDGKVTATAFETYSVWSINKPLLPGQCILTRWQRSSKSAFEEKFSKVP